MYGENLYLGTGGLSDDTIIFRDNFSNMISVGFPRKIIISGNSQKLSYFYFFNMLIVNFCLKTSTFSICLSSISVLKCGSGLLLCLFLNIVKVVLSILRDSLLSLNQLEIFFNSLFISFSSWTGSLWEKRTQVSSGKIIRPIEVGGGRRKREI